MTVHVSPAAFSAGAQQYPPRTVSRLYSEFEAAHESFVAAQLAYDAKKHFAARAELQRAVRACSAIADQLLRTPAQDIQEVLLKTRVYAWENHARYRTLADLDNWKPARRDSAAWQALVNLRDDLRRYQGAAAN